MDHHHSATTLSAMTNDTLHTSADVKHVAGTFTYSLPVPIDEAWLITMRAKGELTV